MTAIPLHPSPLRLADVSMWMERVRQQNDSPATGPALCTQGLLDCDGRAAGGALPNRETAIVLTPLC